MKILLVKPGIKLSDHIQPPLGLAYLAGNIGSNHEVKIIDLPKLGGGINVFKSIIQNEKPDLVGFQCYTPEVFVVKELLEIVKSVSKNILTVVGGPHASLLPDESMDFFDTKIDYLFMGEAEYSFPQFLNILDEGGELETVAGLVWRVNNQILKNPAELIQDLNKLSMPSWELIKPQEYPPAQHGAFYKNFPIAPIITTRGCPFSCVFCSAPIISGKKVRRRSVDSIIEEIRLLYDVHGIREIHIVDDNFTIIKQHAIDVLQRIYASDMNISISFPNGVRIESLDEELVALMKKAGVYLISLGIESGSDKTLKAMNKKLNVNLIEEKIAMIKKFNIDIAGFFIIGFPSETSEDIMKTIDFSIKLPLIRANYFDFLPLPGTPIYNSLQKTGNTQNLEWDKYLFMTASYVPESMTQKELRNLQREAFAKFYLRPKILIKNFMQIRSLMHFKYLLRRFYHWLLV